MDFDAVVERRGTASYKWDRYGPDVLPFWVADMDLPSPPAVVAALQAPGGARRLRVHPRHRRARRGPACPPARRLRLGRWRPRRSSFCPASCPPSTSPVARIAARRRDGAHRGARLPAVPRGARPAGARARDGRRAPRGRPLGAAARRARGGRDAARPGCCSSAIRTTPSVASGTPPRSPRWSTSAAVAAWCSSPTRSTATCSSSRRPTCRPPSPRPPRDELTVTLMAPSKTFNLPGLNFAFAVIPDEGLRRRFVEAGAGAAAVPGLLRHRRRRSRLPRRRRVARRAARLPARQRRPRRRRSWRPSCPG